MRRRILVAAVAAAMLAIVALAPVFLNSEDRVLDSAALKEVGGESVRLGDGSTWYDLSGPGTGQVVVLVHGFSIASFVWDRTAPVLAAAGFRVLRYDLYGRGHSDRVDSDYAPELFERQLSGLLAALKLSAPAHLVGLSMGGAVAARFAASHPERVVSLTLISPFGVPRELDFKSRMVQVPLLGDWLMACFGYGIMMKRLPTNFHEPLDYPSIEQRFGEQMRFEGTLHAFLETLRHTMRVDFTPDFETIGKVGIATMLIWGEEDAVLPFTQSRQVLAALPGTRFEPLAGRGHVPVMERPELTNALLLEFLSTQP